MNMGERIALKRKEKGLTMEALADMLHVGKSAVNKWEKGYVENIKRETIRDMAKIFDCDPAWLLCYTDCDLPQKTFKTPEEFEAAWIKSGGGRHPLELSDHEYKLIVSYRAAEEHIKKSIDTLLQIRPEMRVMHVSTSKLASQIAPQIASQMTVQIVPQIENIDKSIKRSRKIKIRTTEGK